LTLSDAVKVVLEQDDLLDVLCCALDAGPLTIAQLSARTGQSQDDIWWWVVIVLKTAELMREEGSAESGEPLYRLVLDEQPPEVRAAIEAHRRD
jgi:hypothetical protein